MLKQKNTHKKVKDDTKQNQTGRRGRWESASDIMLN